MISNGMTQRLELVQGEEPYLSVTVPRLLRHGTTAEKRTIVLAWLFSLVAAVATGLIMVSESWSGLPVEFGGVTLFITIYPPLVICLWWTISFGWLWGAIPAYLATFILAVYSGMPLGWATLFGFANPLGFAAIALGYQAMPLRRDLRSVEALFFYILITFIGSIFSSAGALIWCFTNQIDKTGILPIWQGWWIGGVLQSVLIVGPILYFTGPVIARWQKRRALLRKPEAYNLSRRILRLVVILALGVLSYGFVTITLGVSQFETALATAPTSLSTRASEVLTATVWVFFWIIALIVLFIGVFNYRFFSRWETTANALMQELTRIANTDHLTNLLNRRAMEEALGVQFSRCSRYCESGAVLMIDLDHFKTLNDRHGHALGDTVLRNFADIIREQIRTEDTAARWGGEEFLILLPHVDAAGAQALAERIRVLATERSTDHDGLQVHCTVSIGIACINQTMPTLNDWLNLADEALYDAKRNGRNQIAVR